MTKAFPATYDVLTDDVDLLAYHFSTDSREHAEAVSQLRDAFPGQHFMFSRSMTCEALARSVVQAFGTYHVYR